MVNPSKAGFQGRMKPLQRLRIRPYRALWRAFSLSLILVLTAMLSGCMYPKDRLAQNVRPAKEAVRSIQAAVDQYQVEQNGLLPIKNSAADTPKYEKFIIDFGKLQRMNYIADIPAAAFEKGGSYYFLILDEETNPTVKLMNLHLYQQIVEIQDWVNAYKNASGGGIPKSEEAYPSFYQIDYDLLKRKAPDLRSVYSGQTMSAIMQEDGTVYADYGIDVRKAVEKSGAKPAPSQDLRELLVSQSDFVPVKSPVYQWVNGDPQAQPKTS